MQAKGLSTAHSMDSILEIIEALGEMMHTLPINNTLTNF